MPHMEQALMCLRRWERLVRSLRARSLLHPLPVMWPRTEQVACQLTIRS